MKSNAFTRALAGVAAAALAFGGLALSAGAASAAEGDATLNPTSITLTGAVGGHTFNAYQLAYYGNTSNANASLGTVYQQDGIVAENGDIKSTALRTVPEISDAVKTAAETAAGTSLPQEYKLGGRYASDDTVDNPAGWVATWTDQTQLRKFVDALAAAELPTAKATVAAETGATSVTVLNSQYGDDAGWYFITDTSAQGTELGTPILVGSTAQGYKTFNGTKLGEAVIKPTYSGEVAAPTLQVDRTSQSVGNKVTYTAVGKLPALLPKGYTYNFVSTADTGLTLNKDAKLYLQATNEDGTLKTDADGNPVFEDTATRGVSSSGDGQTLTVRLTSVHNRTPESYVKIVYTATVGVDSTGFGKYVEPEGGYQYDQAGIATLKNTVHIEYGEDADALASTESASASFKVYKGIEFTKIGADTNAGLAGAKFTVAVKDVENNNATVATNRSIAVSADDGTVSFSGLAAGTYVVSETEVPVGYYANIKPSFEVTINENGTVTFGKDAVWDLVGTENGKTTVTNVNQITQLPSTGGMGIGLLATAIVLAAGAGVFFSAKSVKNRRIAAR